MVKLNSGTASNINKVIHFIAMHWLMTSTRCGFSRLADTRSLSRNCLLIAFSDECVPGVISTFTLKRDGRARSNFTRILSPMRVAIEQCGIVGVNWISTSERSLFTITRDCSSTWSSSSVNGCSGSFMFLIKSKNKDKGTTDDMVELKQIELKFTEYFSRIDGINIALIELTLCHWASGRLRVNIWIQVLQLSHLILFFFFILVLARLLVYYIYTIIN